MVCFHSFMGLLSWSLLYMDLAPYNKLLFLTAIEKKAFLHRYHTTFSINGIY